ncbi:hypothetical protein LINPERHAP2_LOCUS43314 [Linum perenne]
MVKFANEQDYFKALTGGPWMILNHYKMVAWVRFPHLPIHFYHAQVLTSLGNLVRRTIKIDFNTQRAERGKFARIAIELDLNEPLLPVVMLDGAPQSIEYESLPTLCFECGRIGHESSACQLSPDAAQVSSPPGQDPLDMPSSASPWMVVWTMNGRRQKVKPAERGNCSKKGKARS